MPKSICILLIGTMWIVASPSPIPADTLRVGSLFPDLKFQHVLDGSSTGLASLADVQTKRAIVFVFASW